MQLSVGVCRLIFFEHFDLDSLHAIAKKKSLQVTKMAKVLQHSHARHTMMWQWLSIRRPQKIHWFPIALAISIGFAWGSLILRHTQIESLQTDPNKKWSERMTTGKPNKFCPAACRGGSPEALEFASNWHSLATAPTSKNQELKRWSSVMSDHGFWVPYPLPHHFTTGPIPCLWNPFRHVERDRICAPHQISVFCRSPGSKMLEISQKRGVSCIDLDITFFGWIVVCFHLSV